MAESRSEEQWFIDVFNSVIGLPTCDPNSKPARAQPRLCDKSAPTSSISTQSSVLPYCRSTAFHHLRFTCQKPGDFYCIGHITKLNIVTYTAVRCISYQVVHRSSGRCVICLMEIRNDTTCYSWTWETRFRQDRLMEYRNDTNPSKTWCVIDLVSNLLL